MFPVSHRAIARSGDNCMVGCKGYGADLDGVFSGKQMIRWTLRPLTSSSWPFNEAASLNSAMEKLRERCNLFTVVAESRNERLTTTHDEGKSWRDLRQSHARPLLPSFLPPFFFNIQRPAGIASSIASFYSRRSTNTLQALSMKRNSTKSFHTGRLYLQAAHDRHSEQKS